MTSKKSAKAPPQVSRLATPSPDRLATLSARYSLLLDVGPDVVLFHDGSKVVDIAGDFYGLVGWRPEEAIGQSVVGPWVHDGAVAQIRERIAQGFQGRYQTNVQHRDGAVIPVELHVRQTHVDGNLERVVVVRDLREQFAAQARLAEGDARFRTLLEATFEGMVVHRNGYVLEANEGFARMVGVPVQQVIGMTPGAVVTPESVPIIMEHIRSDNSEPYEVVGRRPDGTRFPMQIQGRKVPGDSGIRVTGFRDLTRQREAEAERQQLQMQLLQAQKLEGLGVMAGGIAHDFNNLLTVVLGGIELALTELDADHPAARLIESASAAASRAAVLTRQMLAYAGRAPSDAVHLDLSTVVRETSRLLSVAVPKGAEFELDLATSPLVVRADRGQLEQVVMNLITNAAEALLDRQGQITLRTARLGASHLDAFRPDLVGGMPAPTGPCALLEVTDNGVGIHPDHRGRIFDPFYTTRFQGRGLGLATVLGIVRTHDGAIALRSQLGVGTRFSVLLPLADGPAEQPIAPTAQAEVLRGTALVIDDEGEVAAITASLLRSLGCAVEVLSSGEALIAHLVAAETPPRVVLLDRVMPGMGGDATRQRIQERWPDLPLVVVSGREPPGDLRPDLSPCTFLPKPFRRDELIDALRVLGLFEAPGETATRP